MKPALMVVVLGLLLLSTVISVRTFRFRSRQLLVTPIPHREIGDRMRIAERLAGALQFETVTGGSGAVFLELHRYLEETFPLVQGTLTRETVGEYSLLYTWRGSEAPARPILLLAHLDVVPVEPGTAADWTYPPFAGRVADGFIWGRGALDVKVGVVGILEAVEALLRDGFRPRRTIYLAFGHDEESGGREGAARIATLLRSRGIELDYVLDEGLAITDGIVPGVSRPVALVGLAEKGKVALELTARARGGHASMPHLPTAIGILGAAIQKLERRQPAARLAGATRQLFEYVGPEMSRAKRTAFANLWLFEWLAVRKLVACPETNALVRTTVATTMINGGVEEDLVPTVARAVVNVRILPGDSIAGVVAHLRRVIDDGRVSVELLDHSAFEPSTVSDVESESFAALQRTIQEVFPGVIVAPSLALARTDARHYESLAANSYRFLPMRVTADDLRRVHGTDERIAVDNYEEIVRFYARLIRNSAGT
ncbi:MAG: M20 family peptidase [Gemmatimonadota bacterium]|nr:MAG: M20 family peptidase [Gemmatimonadota bacterium]